MPANMTPYPILLSELDTGGLGYALCEPLHNVLLDILGHETLLLMAVASAMCRSCLHALSLQHGFAITHLEFTAP